MIRASDSVVVRFMCRLLAPFIQLFALYVLFHGHYSPGGGFQGGAMIAASLILVRLSLGERTAQLQFRPRLGLPIGTLGVLLYYGTGLAALMMGGAFLQYAAVAFPGWAPEQLRSLGILAVETGVAISLTGVLVLIFDHLLEPKSGKEPGS